MNFAVNLNECYQDLETVVEEYTIKEVKIEEIMTKIKNDISETVFKMTKEVIESNQHVGENQDLKMAIIQGLLETFRKKIADTSKEVRENIEIAYDLNISRLGKQCEEHSLVNPVKKGPGRPKKIKEEDHNQMKIDGMFAKKA